jgi:hypothetical protein
VRKNQTYVDNVLQIFCHTDLSHELVLISVHARKLADVRKSELKPVRKLESIDIRKTILHMRVDNKLRQAENLTAQMDCPRSVNSKT